MSSISAFANGSTNRSQHPLFLRQAAAPEAHAPSRRNPRNRPTKARLSTHMELEGYWLALSYRECPCLIVICTPNELLGANLLSP